MPVKRMKNAHAKLKSIKHAQAKLDAALQAYYRNYGAGEHLEECLQEKLAERSAASLDAIITLGHVATYMGQIPLANQGNQDTPGLMPDQICAWQNRCEIVTHVMQTLSSYGIGAASVSAAWMAAGLGVASNLSGAAVITSKLAVLGGSAIVAGGGMKLGVAMLGGIPVVTGVLAFGVMSTVSTIKAKKHKDAALKNIAAAECELTRWRERTNLAILRLNELTGAEESLTHALQQLLVQCSPDNPSDVKTLASVSGVLAQIVDIAIADQDGNLLNEDALKNVYRKHVLGARQSELSQAYRRMRVAIASLEHDNAIRTANHILSVITL